MGYFVEEIAQETKLAVTNTSISDESLGIFLEKLTESNQQIHKHQNVNKFSEQLIEKFTGKNSNAND